MLKRTDSARSSFITVVTGFEERTLFLMLERTLAFHARSRMAQARAIYEVEMSISSVDLEVQVGE